MAPSIPIGLRLEVCPSGGVIERAKMKSRTQIRRADKIEFEKRLWSTVSSLFLTSWEPRISIDFPENPEN
jgi:hypothetical protein